MTHNIAYQSASVDNQWNNNTLRPAPLNPKHIIKDLIWHWKIYKKANLKLFEIAYFIFLRLSQIIAYKKGWSDGERIYLNKM